MRFVVASIFIVGGLFFLLAAKQIGRDTQRTRSIIGEIPAGAARIFGVGALFLGVVWLVY